MHFSTEQARTQTVTACERIFQAFGRQEGALDAEFFSGSRKAALGFAAPQDGGRRDCRRAVPAALRQYAGERLEG